MAGFSRLALLLAALGLGCGGSNQPTTRSPTITSDSPEFRKAAEDADRIDKEHQAAERKAFGVRRIEKEQGTTP
jgi:hypothetical protein